MLDRLTLTDFDTHLGEEYVLELSAERRVPLVLTEARAVGAAPLGDSTRVPFALVFDARGSERLDQRTYSVRFPSGERVEMFLVPVANLREGGVRLEAVFT